VTIERLAGVSEHEAAGGGAKKASAEPTFEPRQAATDGGARHPELGRGSRERPQRGRVSHASAGDDVGKVVTPIVLAALLVASWMLRSSSRTLAAAAQPLERKAGVADATLAESA
jgi:hypothetical protein